MSDRSTDLLARWIAENVHAVPPSQRESESHRLAAEFLAFAEDAGLSAADVAELEEEIGEDIGSHMVDALETAGTGDDDASA
jgi:hypothetical protein